MPLSAIEESSDSEQQLQYKAAYYHFVAMAHRARPLRLLRTNLWSRSQSIATTARAKALPTTTVPSLHAQPRCFSSAATETISDRETITRLLYSLASRKEVERYLRIFSAANKFAVLKVGGAILTHQLEELALSLSFLHRV